MRTALKTEEVILKIKNRLKARYKEIRATVIQPHIYCTSADYTKSVNKVSVTEANYTNISFTLSIRFY